MKKSLLYSLFFLLLPALLCAGEPKTLKMTAIRPEVITGGVGLCLIFETPDGRVFLYDTANGNNRISNPEACEGVKNNGRDLVVPWLRAHGYEKIDGLVISHAHADHYGGFIWMAKNFPILQLWDSGFVLPGTDPEDFRDEQGLYQRLRKEYAETHPGARHIVRAGDSLDWGKDLKVEVVWPPRDFTTILENPNRMKGDTEVHHLVNANAIALQITYGNVKFFVVGDIQEDYLRERMIPFIPAEKWKCDVCVLPSHGVHTVQEEVERTRPKIAVSCMGDIPWARPLPGRIKRFYEPVGAKVYCTLTDGNVTVITDGQTIDVKTETF